MLRSRVIGHATSTIRHPSMKGVRLLVCEPVDDANVGTGQAMVAADWMGAGRGDLVLVTSDGDASYSHTGDRHTPLRNVVMGIIDESTGVPR